MDSIDATNREVTTENAVTPSSLLAIVLDTNPVAWDSLSSLLSLMDAVANLLVFINAHLAMNGSNQIAILASHTDRVAWLYPTPKNAPRKNQQNGTHAEENANKYRPFLAIEQEIMSNLRQLLHSTASETLDTQPNATQIAGSLTTALAYINQQTLLASPGKDSFNQSVDISLQTTQSGVKSDHKNVLARILVISVSSDLSEQYISVMNSIFAAQRLQIPIDVLKLAGSTVFLEQAADATEGVYQALNATDMRGGAGLLQYLMMGHLPDVTARQYLNAPGNTGVDFRAYCFCHRRVVSIGYVCSVCLSIFCDPMELPSQQCLTCGTVLILPTNWNVQPALIPKKKKKKKITDGVASGASTPASGIGTPAH